MRAVFIENPGEIRFGSTSPPDMGDDELLLRVERIGLCGSDLNTFRGRNPLVSYPRIPGHEIAATVDKIGRNVPPRFSRGQLVSLNPYKNCGKCAACRNNRINACTHNETMGVQREGAMTDFIAVPWQRVVTSSMTNPDHLALIEPMAVGFHAAHRGAVKEGQTVCVFGCGAIGLGVIAGCIARGAAVIAVDIDDRKLEIAKAVGAVHCLNASNGDLLQNILEISKSDGVQVAIEAVGLPHTFLQCIDVVATTGTVVYVGYSQSPVTYETKNFLVKELDIRGSRGAIQSDFDAAVRYLESGAFPADLVISQVFSFADAGKAFARWDSDPSTVTKFLIDMRPPSDRLTEDAQ